MLRWLKAFLRGGRWLIGCLLLPAAALAQPGADLVTLPVRDGVTLTYLLVIDPAVPVEQVVVLFSGGAGNVPMRPASTRPQFAERGNFLVRTRYLWAEGGFASAVVGVPSDRTERGLDDAFRTGRPTSGRAARAVDSGQWTVDSGQAASRKIAQAGNRPIRP